MVTNEEEMKAEEELLKPENGTENGTEEKAAEVTAAVDPMEEEHTTEFEVHLNLKIFVIQNS